MVGSRNGGTCQGCKMSAESKTVTIIVWIRYFPPPPYVRTYSFPSSDVESKTLQGVKGQCVLDQSGQYQLENTTLDYQKLSDKEVLRIPGPLGADFTIQVSAQSHFRCFKCGVIDTAVQKFSPHHLWNLATILLAGPICSWTGQYHPIHLLPAHRPSLEGNWLLPLLCHLWRR